ncbi:MAG: alpha/beta hydrolase [Candidatus Delongbacteria bacterium]|jgi:alpha-beta hydrolase superfamily lysophospholipase|nr:alpha/beta hydrolase [Candidatus Delongbacteria bacterium]
MKEQQGQFPSATGQHVFYRVWEPETKPKAVLQIIHGMAEHSARYTEFATYMCGQGFVVAANDHPGHGVTGEKAGKVGFFDEKQGWNNVVRDIIYFNTQLHTRYHIPVIILGHSMGSFLARHLMIIKPDIADRWILSGTGYYNLLMRVGGFMLANLSLYFKAPQDKAGLLHALSFGAYNKKFSDEESKNAWLCSDENVLKAYNKDNLCGFVASSGFYRDLLYGINIIHKKKNLKKMRTDLKVFLISGQDDPIGNFGKGVKKVKALFEKYGLKPEIMLYPNMRHEVLNEKGKSMVCKDVLDFCSRAINN